MDEYAGDPRYYQTGFSWATHEQEITGTATSEELDRLKELMAAIPLNTEKMTEAMNSLNEATTRATEKIVGAAETIRTEEQQIESMARTAYETYSDGVTTTKWGDIAEGMRDVWMRTAGAIRGHLNDQQIITDQDAKRAAEDAKLKRADGKRVSRSKMGAGQALDMQSMKATLFGEEIIDRDHPARFTIGLDAAQRPVRFFLDNVEISRQVGEFSVEHKFDRGVSVTITFAGASVDTINVNEMPHNPRLKMNVRN